jgi:hypothetical protein
MKLANWNLERANTDPCRLRLRKEVDRIDADIWVFTETRDSFSPGDGYPYSYSSASGRDGIGVDQPEDRWVAVHSKYPLQQLPTKDKARTVAVRVFPPAYSPFLIFGTVLPWIGDKWRGFPSKAGVAFKKALDLQKSDWKKMWRSFPDDELFVIGDFNQDLVLPHFYGSQENRDALRDALNEFGLRALTGDDDDPIRRDSPPFACIDHICFSNRYWKPEPAIRWPDKPDKRLSDHFGVAVSLNQKQ